jgi:hypothetical protein
MDMTRKALTADAVHNWDSPYIQQQYAHLSPEIQAAARAAMIRHHQRGSDAREEALLLNQRFGLRE